MRWLGGEGKSGVRSGEGGGKGWRGRGRREKLFFLFLFCYRKKIKETVRVH